MARPRSRFDSEKSLGDLEHDSDLSHSSEDDKDSVVFGISGPRNWGVQDHFQPTLAVTNNFRPHAPAATKRKREARRYIMGFADPTRAPRRLSCDGFSAPTRNREQQREAKARAARDRLSLIHI